MGGGAGSGVRIERLRGALGCPHACDKCREALEALNRLHSALTGAPFTDAPCIVELVQELERIPRAVEAAAAEGQLFLEQVRRILGPAARRGDA